MKQYSSAEALVLSLAKDCKNALQTSAQFEFSYNDIQAVITSMNNQNTSKVTIYTGTVNGVAFSGSITALKKRLNVTYTKEYSRSAEGTKVVIKSDEELQATAKVADERIKQAVATLNKYANRYLIRFDQLVNDGHEYEDENGNPTWKTVYDLILAQLKQERDTAKAEAKRKAEEAAAKIASEKAKLERQLAELQAKLAKMK